MIDSLLLLPGDVGFEEILAHTPPPDCRGNSEIGRVVMFGADGMPRTANSLAELEDYAFGGEWDEVVMDHDDPFFDESYL
jgi:hypothetical protein